MYLEADPTLTTSEDSLNVQGRPLTPLLPFYPLAPGLMDEVCPNNDLNVPCALLLATGLVGLEPPQVTPVYTLNLQRRTKSHDDARFAVLGCPPRLGDEDFGPCLDLLVCLTRSYRPLHDADGPGLAHDAGPGVGGGLKSDAEKDA